MSLLRQTDEIFFAKTDLDLSKTQSMVQDALLGAEDGELYLEYSQYESLVWDDGKLKSANFETEQGFGLRSVAGEATGYAHSTNFNEESLRRAAGAVSSVKAGYKGTLALAPLPTNQRYYPDLNPLQSKSFEEKINLLQEIDAYVRAKDSRIHQVSVSLSAKWQAIQIIGAGGFRAADIRPLMRLGVSVVTKDGTRLENGGTGGGGRMGYDRYFEPSMWQSIADEAVRKALINQEAVDAKAGEMTVVLGPGWPAVLLHEAIGHGLEADYNRKKTSVFSDLMGTQIAAKGVTIVDDGTIEGRRGSLTIDDEGTPAQCTTLIEDGKLVGYMQDRMNARLMGKKSTGNGRRESFACQPYPRMTNTMMYDGSYEHDEIIASVEHGIYAADFGGGQVEPASGNFVFSANEAYEIENGKIGRPLKGASLVGSGSEALKRISMVGNDTALDKGVGVCGKAGQSVPVGVGQPTMKLENMTVGGASV